MKVHTAKLSKRIPEMHFFIHYWIIRQSVRAESDTWSLCRVPVSYSSVRPFVSVFHDTPLYWQASECMGLLYVE